MSVPEDHPIRTIGPKVDVYDETDVGILAEIDEDEQTGLPIFALCYEDGSQCVFMFPNEGDPHIRILHISTHEEMSMGPILDEIVDRFGMDVLSFFNIINPADLKEAVDGLSTKTKKFQGERVIVGWAKWES